MADIRIRIGILLTIAVTSLVSARCDCRADDATTLQVAYDSGMLLLAPRLTGSIERSRPSSARGDHCCDSPRQEIPAARPENDDLSEANEGIQKAPTASPRLCGQTRVPNAGRAAVRAAAKDQADSATGRARLQI
jgi:hypothetical protein